MNRPILKSDRTEPISIDVHKKKKKIEQFESPLKINAVSFLSFQFDVFSMMIRWRKMMFKRVMILDFLTFADIMNRIKQQNIIRIL